MAQSASQIKKKAINAFKLTPAQKAANYTSNLAAWNNAATKAPGYKAPAAPAAPAAAYDPFSNPYFQGVWNTAEKNYANTVTHLTDNENQTALDYGATLTRDANNNVTGSKLDYSGVSSPFSKAALLQRNYDQQREGTTNSMAARGQLYSGSLLNRRGNEQFGFEQGQDSLQKQLASILLGSNQARDNAATERNNQGTAGFLGSLDRVPTP